MTYTSDTFFQNVFGKFDNINFFQSGTEWILPLIMVLVIALLISPRKMSNIKVLALPLMLGFSIIGLNIPMLFLVIAGIMFAMDILSVKGIGEIIESVSTTVQSVTPTALRERRINKHEKKLSTLTREETIDKKKSNVALTDFQKMFGKGKEYKKELERRKDKGFIEKKDKMKSKSGGMKINVIGKKKYVEVEGMLYEVAE